MCGTHTENVIYSGCKLLKESSNKSSYSSYLFANPADTGANKPHLVVLYHVYPCKDAPENTPNGTCGNSTSVILEDKIKKIGVSEYDDDCPVCVAADEAAFQTIYHARSAPAAAADPKEADDNGQGSKSKSHHKKRRHGEHGSSSRRESRK